MNLPFVNSWDWVLAPVVVPGTAIPQDPALDLDPGSHARIPPPWQTRGQAALEFAQFPVALVQDLIPLDIIQTWPGYTLGVVGFIHYDQTPVGPYNEFIIAPALVRHGTNLSFWVTTMTVDSPASQVNGQSNWGLPKTLGTLDYHWGEQSFLISGTQGDLLKASYTNPTRDIVSFLPDLPVPPLSFSLPLLTYTRGKFRAATADFRGAGQLISWRMSALGIDPQPYQLVESRETWLGVAFSEFTLTLGAPI
ncbi:acetoacetate decarboxylase family protein [Candidatus Cyanaurora vandensis]|uniref:acetoacetate decarboxylase family protein n=1 Tax=Candidatus Cyanaurora vandensis TaxID=2714958 RepID=UPI00257ECF36|nr:acetoacetate decarboxylase family protein [Candidatus Cyanaurora vandensis]